MIPFFKWKNTLRFVRSKGQNITEWGKPLKNPSFVSPRATMQSSRRRYIYHWWRPKNKREWRYVEFSSGDGSIFPQKLERISKNLGGNPSWASPTRDCPLGFWIFSLVFSWIFCNPPSLTSTYCYNSWVTTLFLAKFNLTSLDPLLYAGRYRCGRLASVKDGRLRRRCGISYPTTPLKLTYYAAGEKKPCTYDFC